MEIKTATVFDGLISRKDGQDMDSEDDDSLLEFGGLTRLFLAFADVPLVGDLEASPTGTFEPSAPPSPFADLARVDGALFNDGDEAALTEFAPLFYLNLTANSYFGAAEGLGPFADPELTAIGIKWGREAAEMENSIIRADGRPLSRDEQQVFLTYSAWALLGTLLMSIYKRLFGTLDGISTMGQKAGIKRKPSGAELSAFLGRLTQSNLGLDDAKRTVHARGVM